jgi:purine-binding chemotaxis protein CheW
MSAEHRLTSLDWDAVRRRLSELAVETAAEFSPQRARAVMDVRAAELARVIVQQVGSSNRLDLVTFSLNGDRFAIEACYVREMVRPLDITPVPGLPELLAGVINLRGSVLAVFDLVRFLGLEKTEERPWVLVLGRERAEFGVSAAEIGDLQSLPADEIFPAEAAGIGDACVRGVTKDAMVVLDGAALLSDSRLFIDEGG